MHRRNGGGGIGLALALTLAAALLPSAARAEGPCDAAIAGAEAAEGIPAGLLAAIGRVESGRGDGNGGRRPWPWTINAEGQGRYFDGKDEAMAEVGRLLGRRVGLVDVGCMGVNLYHHPSAFPTLADAFDPAVNAQYAARFLRSLLRETGSWERAIARYHSADPRRGGAYLARVLAEWKGVPPDPAVVPEAPAVAVEDTPLHRATQAFAAGDVDAAAALFADVLAVDPDDRTALLGVAMVLEVQGHAAEARVAYRRLLQVEPRNALAMTNMLDLVDRLPDTEQRRELGSLRGLLPQSPEVTARLAQLLAAQGDDAAAAALMGEAVRLDPGRPAWLLSLAILHDRLGRQRDAVQHYERFFAAAGGAAPLPGVSVDAVRRRLAFLKTGAR